MPALDKIITLRRVNVGATPFPITSNGAAIPGMNLRLRVGPDTRYRYNSVIRAQLYINNTPVANIPNMGGALPAGAIISIGGTAFEVAAAATFAERSVTPPHSFAWASIDRDHVVIGDTTTETIPSVDTLIAMAGIPADVRLATGFGQETTLKNQATQSPIGYSNFNYEQVIGRLLPGSGTPHRARVTRLIQAPFKRDLPSAAFGQFAEYQPTQQLPFGQDLIWLTEYIGREGFGPDEKDGAAIVLVSSPLQEGGTAGAGERIWARLVSEGLSETIADDDTIKPVADAQWLIFDNIVLSTYDLIIDDFGRAWDIQGIERQERGYALLNCQRGR